jgi:hypothetical protein
MIGDEQRDASVLLAGRTFRDAERRLKEILGSSPNEERAAWKLYNFYHCAERLAKFRESLINTTTGSIASQAVSSAQMNLLAAECHAALDVLLGIVGLRAENNEWVLGQLTMQLRGLPTDLAGSRLVARRLRPETVLMFERWSEIGIHASETPGTVIKHTDKTMIVRFDLDGLIEERSFWWDELKATAEQLPVGTKVIGIARLAKATETAKTEDSGKATREIHEAVEADMAKLGPDAKKPLGRETSPEDQARALEEWRRIAPHPPADEKNQSHEG